jgi:hypothetical protein
MKGIHSTIGMNILGIRIESRGYFMRQTRKDYTIWNKISGRTRHRKNIQKNICGIPGKNRMIGIYL